VKEGIHPDYKEVKVVCACGDAFTTRSTRTDIRLDICSKCHPFFTGKQKGRKVQEEIRKEIALV
jgi:large subunit ribosomal protein L31